MRRKVFCRLRFYAVFLSVVFLGVVSCRRSAIEDKIPDGQIRLHFPDAAYKAVLKSVELPDTNDFILNVCSADGSVIYSGAYGDSPEVMTVPPGSYSISVKSCEFTKPRFSEPQFGDEQCVVVPSDGVVDVELQCRQINSGIRLRISPEFLTVYPDGVLFVSSDDGRLMYGYSEKRIAYFRPGSVSVVLNSGGKDETIMTRSLDPQEILSVGIHASVSADEKGGSVSISVDTTRIWTEEDLVIGENDSDRGEIPENALSVSQAKDNVGSEDVWVCGYIVGGDLSKNSVSFTPPFSAETNFAIASRSSVKEKSSCLSVALPSGDIRDALNLSGNPGNLGRRVYLRGDIVESYFGITGIKNISDYVLK